nr:hypothetical protein [Tanacetum cinerariifolium]
AQHRSGLQQQQRRGHGPVHVAVLPDSVVAVPNERGPRLGRLQVAEVLEHTVVEARDEQVRHARHNGNNPAVGPRNAVLGRHALVGEHAEKHVAQKAVRRESHEKIREHRHDAHFPGGGNKVSSKSHG